MRLLQNISATCKLPAASRRTFIWTASVLALALAGCQSSGSTGGGAGGEVHGSGGSGTGGATPGSGGGGAGGAGGGGRGPGGTGAGGNNAAARVRRAAARPPLGLSAGRRGGPTG